MFSREGIRFCRDEPRGTDVKVDWNLMGKYLSGECSGEEEARLEAWMREKPEREAIVEDLRQVWQTTARPPSRWNVEDLWSRLRQHVQDEEAERKPVRLSFDRPSVPRRTRASSSRRRPLLRVAAILVVVAVVGVLFAVQPWKASPEEGAAVQMVATKRGEQATLRLADGTRVHLNVGSKLTYPRAFGKDVRGVDLQGEAFFEVTPDAGRPFVVRTGRAVVRVLGTAFDVRAYAEDEAAHVAVAEGRVAVRTPPGRERDTVVVQPGDVVTIEDRRMRVQHLRDLDRYLAWTEGRVVFEAAPFDEVARRLERVYDLEVELTVPVDSVGHLTASFDDEPLTEILRIVAAALGLEYRPDGRKIVFHPAGMASPSP